MINVIKHNKIIRKLLIERKKELNISNTFIHYDAKNLGRNIVMPKLTVYFKNEEPKYGSLTEEDILWLCFRYGISVKVKVEKQEYNEKNCIELIKNYF